MLVGQVSGIFAVIGVIWSKCSFALTLLRIAGKRVWLKWLLWGVIISINVFMATTTIMFWTACRPLEKNWYPMRHPEGTCPHPKVRI